MSDYIPAGWSHHRPPKLPSLLMNNHHSNWGAFLVSLGRDQYFLCRLFDKPQFGRHRGLRLLIQVLWGSNTEQVCRLIIANYRSEVPSHSPVHLSPPWNSTWIQTAARMCHPPSLSAPGCPRLLGPERLLSPRRRRRRSSGWGQIQRPGLRWRDKLLSSRSHICSSITDFTHCK